MNGDRLRLPVNRNCYRLMTLNDLECQNRGFMNFLAILGCDKSISFTRRRHARDATRYATADVYIYMEVNKMSSLIDFNHLQTILLSVVYSRIKTFSSIAIIMTTKL